MSARSILAGLALATALAAGPVRAEDALIPLETEVQTNPDMTYALVRCAALYDSLLDYYADDAFDDETAASYRAGVSNMMRAAAVIRSGAARDRIPAEQVDVNEEVLALSDEYTQRYTAASAADDDALITSDLTTCRILLDLVNAQ